MQNRSDKSQVRVLIATEDIAFGATLEDFIAHAGYALDRTHDTAGVLRLTSLRRFEVIVLDHNLAEGADVDVLSFIREKNPQTRLILLFDVARIEQALDAVRQGAFFYLPLTCPPSDVALAVEKAVRHFHTEVAVSEYEQTVFEELVGHTPAMQRVVEIIQKVAPTDSTVLLLGESGTGKEVLANTVHRLSRRAEKAFIAVNCAALPEGLLESELFGHVKGAFTGADRDKRGLFEEASGGTIFLDEIGDMALVTQAKLLRVLQNGEIRRVGASTSQRVDVRVLAATNRDLVEAVQQGHFREDLYFRLNVIQIRIPPLRERMDALPTLIAHFLELHNRAYDRRIRALDDAALSLLRNYEFPGNVRELESIIAHAVIMADGDVIRAKDLPDQVQYGLKPRLALGYVADDTVLSLSEMEAQHIRRALERFENNQTVVAKKLGISRSTLWRKLKEYGIEV